MATRQVLVRHQHGARHLGAGRLARAKPSTIGGKSVPGLAKKYSIPCRRSDASTTSPAVAAISAAGWPAGLRFLAI